jgi:hypothetical protein
MIKLLIVAMLFLTFSVSAKPETYDPFFEVTYFAFSKHLSSGNYNSKHNLIGIEYRNLEHGLGITTFKNSYFEQSTLIAYTRYWQPKDFIETSISVGYVTGYEFVNKGIIASIAYTKYKRFVPKLSIFGGAIVLSFSYRF